MMKSLLAIFLTLISVTVVARAIQQPAEIKVGIVRLPAGGIQPQVAIDESGVVHVVYFSGEPANGNLYYSRLEGDSFSPPLIVNSQPDSAIATGTIRGGRIAIGRNGQVHVAWNGSSKSVPKGTATPMLYSQLNANRSAFEPQRNLIQHAVGIDGGGAIAADPRGRVFVAWHAGGPDSKGEGDRRVWLATSTDDGRTFSREKAISDVTTGAC